MSALGLWAAGAALGANRVVDTTADTDTGNATTLRGTLRWHLARANPGDTITFATSAFPVGSVTPIAVGAGGAALPTLTDASVVVDGAGRVAIACVATLTVGNGLTVAANDVAVAGLEIRDCPDHGLSVTGLRVQVGATAPGRAGNYVHDNDKLGILVTGLSTSTSEVAIAGNEVAANCRSTTASCAGIGVRKGTGTGSGPSLSTIGGNVVYATAGAGHGIAVFAGFEHRILSNIVSGNEGAGIAVASTTTGVFAQADEIAWNEVTDNLQAGLLLGTRSQGSSATDNLIDGNGAGPGAAHPGIDIFGSDDQVLERNVVLRSGADGIRIAGLVGGNPARRALLRDNLVGIDAAGVGGPNGGHGIAVSGKAANLVNHEILGNVVATNGGDGIRVDAGGVEVRANVVGLGPIGLTPKPNGGVGIRVTSNGAVVGGDDAGVPTPNVVATNLGGGVSSSGSGALIAGNLVGWNADADVPLGNAGVGIRIAGGANVAVRDNVVGNHPGHGIQVEPVGSASLTNPVVHANRVTGNGGAGIRLAGVSLGAARWTANEVSGNGSCGIEVGGTVNPGARDAVPVLLQRTGAYYRGSWTGAGLTLDHVQVFADDGADPTEPGRFLGRGDPGPGGTWTFTADPVLPEVPEGAAISVLAVFTDGRTSRLTELCGDGCAEPGPASCADGDPCTTDTCAGTCTHTPASSGSCEAVGGCLLGIGTCQSGQCMVPTPSFAPEGTPCVDDDGCSLVSECDGAGACEAVGPECDDGNPCTADDPECVFGTGDGCGASTLRPAGFQCEDGDLCGMGDVCDSAGTCVGGSVPWVCPEETACNVCTCVPEEGCVCEPLDDGLCGPDDLDVDASGRLLDDDCADPDQPDPMRDWDIDGDGLPNVWERSGANLDCQWPPDVLAIDLHENSPDLFWELDHLASHAGRDFLVPPYLLELQTPLGEPIASIRDTFLDAGVFLHVDDAGTAIPYREVVTLDDARTPAYGTPVWTSYRQLRALHFDSPHRRGVYSYAVFVDNINQPIRGFSGLGDIGGDRALVAYHPTELGRASALVHEKGHNLDLDHGGDDKVNFKVNYLSRMNYASPYLLDVDNDVYRFDYSWAAYEPVDEADVTETDGLYAGTDPLFRNYAAIWRCPDGLSEAYGAAYTGDPAMPANRRVDFDCDGDDVPEDHFAQELDGQGGLRATTSWNDWEHLDFAFQRLPGFHGGPRPARDREPLDRPKAWGRPDAEVMPGCAVAEIPTSGPSRPSVVIYGTPELDVADLERVRFAGAVADTTDERDVDGDGRLDWVGRFLLADLGSLSPTAVRAPLWGLTSETRLLLTVPITRPANGPDPDGDGIHQGCDLCPTLGDPPNGTVDPDGCPP